MTTYIKSLPQDLSVKINFPAKRIAPSEYAISASLQLNAELSKSLKFAAIEHGMSLQQIFVEASYLWLAAQEGKVSVEIGENPTDPMRWHGSELPEE